LNDKVSQKELIRASEDRRLWHQMVAKPSTLLKKARPLKKRRKKMQSPMVIAGNG